MSNKIDYSILQMIRDDIRHFFKMQLIFVLLMIIYQLFYSTFYGDLAINGPYFYFLLAIMLIIDTGVGIYCDYRKQNIQKLT